VMLPAAICSANTRPCKTPNSTYFRHFPPRVLPPIFFYISCGRQLAITELEITPRPFGIEGDGWSKRLHSRNIQR
jgi:hypothetical protein